MDFGLFFTTLLGSAGVFGLVQFLISRHDNRNDRTKTIEKKLNKIENWQEDLNLRMTRMELTSLLRNDPENIDAILQVAEYYFIELDGNAYAHAAFEKWAIKHGVAIGWLPKLTKTKGGKNGKR